MPRSEEEQARDVAKSLGVAGATATGSTLAATLLQKGIKATGIAGKRISHKELAALSEAMGFPTQVPTKLIQRGPHMSVGTYPKGWVMAPSSSGMTIGNKFIPRYVDMPAMAHEFGHFKGGPIQKATRSLKQLLFTTPKIRGRAIGPQVSPAHIPLLLAAIVPKGEKKDALRWAQEHPAEIAAALTAVPLAQEAHASARAIRGIAKLPKAKGGGRGAALRASLPLGKSFGITALSHLPVVAGLWAASKIRDRLQKKSLEKKGSYGKLIETSLLSL